MGPGLGNLGVGLTGPACGQMPGSMTGHRNHSTEIASTEIAPGPTNIIAHVTKDYGWP
jgi:hypothetical protein